MVKKKSGKRKKGEKIGGGVLIAVAVAGVGVLLYYLLKDKEGLHTYMCAICGEQFTTYEELVAHMMDEHPGEWPPPEGDLPALYERYLEYWSIGAGGERNWDFSPINWMLDTSEYESAPSSLRVNFNYQSRYGGALCNLPDSINVPEGRLVTSFMANYRYVRPVIYFRNQSPIGQFDDKLDKNHFVIPLNTYYITIEANSARCQKRTNETPYSWPPWTHNAMFEPDKFNIARVTWWKHMDALVIRFEHLENGMWIAAEPDVWDTTPSFEGSQINRLGVGMMQGRYGGYVWFDDTGIWKAE